MNRPCLSAFTALLLPLAACGDPVVLAEYLTVIDVSPSHGAINVSPDVDVRVTFSHALDPGSVDTGAWLGGPDGEPVDAAPSLSDDGYTLFLVPEAPLDDATTWTVNLETEIAGQAVAALPAAIRTSFTTAGLSAGGDIVPVAEIVPPLDPCETGRPVPLDASNSYDPEGEPLDYAWRVVEAPEGDPPLLEAAGEPLATMTALVAGRHVVGLTVSASGQASAEALLELDCR